MSLSTQEYQILTNQAWGLYWGILTQSRGSIDPGQGGLYKYDQGPIFPSMTPALRQTCLFGRQKTEICGSWNFSGNGPYGKIQTKQECSDLPQDYLAI